MDAADIALIVVGIVGALAIIAAGFLLDRRTHRVEAEKGWRAWSILTRVRRELFDRLHGPLRLQDHRSDALPKKPKRKAATPRPKRSRKPTR